MAEGTCENCADETDSLAAVRRIYIEAESADRPEKITRLDEVELWCIPCRTIYPHEPVTDV